MNQCDECDIVTGLPLYDYFTKRAHEELELNFTTHRYALVSTDISNFKYINRIYGYVKANDLMHNLAEILALDNENNVISCRTHSDHFISLFYFSGNEREFLSQIEECSTRFIKYNACKYPSVTLHLNNGIYFLDNEEEDLIYSIDKANVARRVSKGNYCVTSVLFSEDMMGRKENDARVIAEFDSAIKSDRVKVMLQPKIDIVTHKVVGAEALSRLYDERGCLMVPDEFIPVLENSGKIVELDRYVMKTVFSMIKKWITNGIQPIMVSINLSRMHFYENNIADNIYRRFIKYNIPAEYVEFELTESLFFAETADISREISKLRSYGFKVSMDDFGVGYSTLNSLGSLPVDIIKFDKGFVKSSMNNDTEYEILRSLISVFKKINYDVICEGIETKEDEKMIFECGCDTAQGFLYDRPIEIGTFEKKYFYENK